ncbi:MAG TPA: 2Fe-2S iron-sulfur cluster-binding protein [Xanthobacteraceae bacterium]|nr:2Fe-2S iron-sulfur cluster-binding protein [Xanthobacteraceae bacterium]
MNELVPAGTVTIRFCLNGVEHTARTRADARLVDLLREHFALIAAKAACRIGRCGSCLVLLNGNAVNACLLMAWQIDGAKIISPEALAILPEGRIVHEALVAEVAFQCGYCAPGFAVALTALLRTQPDADEIAIRSALEGNICRCTGYSSILRGAIRAQKQLASQKAANRDVANES